MKYRAILKMLFKIILVTASASVLILGICKWRGYALENAFVLTGVVLLFLSFTGYGSGITSRTDINLLQAESVSTKKSYENAAEKVEAPIKDFGLGLVTMISGVLLILMSMLFVV